MTAATCAVCGRLLTYEGHDECAMALDQLREAPHDEGRARQSLDDGRRAQVTVTAGCDDCAWKWTIAYTIGDRHPRDAEDQAVAELRAHRVADHTDG